MYSSAKPLLCNHVLDIQKWFIWTDDTLALDHLNKRLTLTSQAYRQKCVFTELFVFYSETLLKVDSKINEKCATKLDDSHVR